MANLVPTVNTQLVAVDFWEDEAFSWHERALLEKVGDGGKWLARSPDFEVEVLDLGEHRVVPLRKGEPYPERVRGYIYRFATQGEGGLTDESLRGPRGERGPS